MAWVFSYGSLVNKRTREFTGNSGRAFPARVTGYQRKWNWHHPSQGRTALGVAKIDAAKINGMIVEIPDEELDKFDQREYMYYREKVHINAIELFEEVDVEHAWIYIPENPVEANHGSPIVQTYVDVIIDALLDVDEDFAREFLKSTEDWHLPMVNDRDNPRYPRHLDNLKLKEIDKLFQECVKR